MSRRRMGRILVLVLLIGAGGIIAASRSKGVRAKAPTREALRAAFDADTRNLVYVWDPADPRPERERRRKLLDFAYEGYDSSAWIPQSVLDGNPITRAVVGDADTIVGGRIGLVLWPENRAARAYGMAPNPTPGTPLSWTINCLACHTAEIDGVAYLGAGGKVLDEKVFAEMVERVTGESGRRAADPAEAALAADAHDSLRRHHPEGCDPLTRGRSAGFRVSHAELHARAFGAMPEADRLGRGDVKVPPLWHTAAKLSSGRWYCDGSFRGEFPLLSFTMDLEPDPTSRATAILRDEFREVVQYLRPPRYPYPIDRKLAEAGKALFTSREMGCAGCHGTYDGAGQVSWPGVHADVGTDRARLDLVSDEFIGVFDRSPLAPANRLVRSIGYAATPLTGVWANYPYLHNGSVPTLEHLLGPATERPAIFSVQAARRFDPRRVGQRLRPDGPDATASEAEVFRKQGDNRDWFSTARPGCDNRGHDFWPRIRTDANRRALIEYLKTL